MAPFPHPERFALSGFVGGPLVLLAGLVALLNQRGPVLPSVLLTVAAMLFVVGFGAARAKPRRFDVGLLVPVAAALPLFGLFYAMGVVILERFGHAIGGWLLIGLGAVLTATSAFFALRSANAARHRARGAEPS